MVDRTPMETCPTEGAEIRPPGLVSALGLKRTPQSKYYMLAAIHPAIITDTRTCEPASPCAVWSNPRSVNNAAKGATGVILEENRDQKCTC
jgi:hypothetical protein